MSSPQWLFASFPLDLDNACLWRGAQAITPTPKAFEVLHSLVTHPDRLVTKDTLLDAVWPETAISDTVVHIAIGELHHVLGRLRHWWLKQDFDAFGTGIRCYPEPLHVRPEHPGKFQQRRVGPSCANQ